MGLDNKDKRKAEKAEHDEIKKPESNTNTPGSGIDKDFKKDGGDIAVDKAVVNSSVPQEKGEPTSKKKDEPAPVGFPVVNQRDGSLDSLFLRGRDCYSFVIRSCHFSHL